jgi:hypothetical protein
VLFPEFEHVHDAEISWHHWCAYIPVRKQGSQRHCCQKVDLLNFLYSHHTLNVFFQYKITYVNCTALEPSYKFHLMLGVKLVLQHGCYVTWEDFANTATAVCMSTACITAPCAEFDSRPLYNIIEQFCLQLGSLELCAFQVVET